MSDVITSCFVKIEPPTLSPNESDDSDQIQEREVFNNFALKEESLDDVDQQNDNQSSDSSFNYEDYRSKNECVDDESCQVDIKNVTLLKAEFKLDGDAPAPVPVPVPLLKEEIDIEEHKPNNEEARLKSSTVNEHCTLAELQRFYKGRRARNKIFKCDSDGCSYETKRRNDLRRHVYCKHIENIDLFQCDACPYKTKVKAYLNSHFDRKHREDGDVFRCDSDGCSFKTKLKIYLNKHYDRNHREGADKFECSRCSYKTKYKCNLKLHFNRKHAEHAELLKCDRCPYETKTKSNLTSHFNYIHKGRTELFEGDNN